MATSKRQVEEKKNFIEELYGVNMGKCAEWFKRNGLTLLLIALPTFWLGYYKGQSNIALDCKYAKALRVDSEAYKCERIL